MSLPELIVSVLLMAMLTLLAARLMSLGSTYLKDGKDQLDLQEGMLLAMNWISKDVAESSLVAIYASPWGAPPVPPIPPAPGPPKGIVMASPRDANGQISFTGTSINWNSRVCYYVDLADNGKLYRVTLSHPPETLPRVIDPTVEGTAFFQANLSTLPRRLLAERISYFNVERQAAGVDISLETATRDRKFTMLVTTLVRPRN